MALAQLGHVGGETVVEGDAGFYHAYTGNNKGQLTCSFVGDTQTNLDKITTAQGFYPGQLLSWKWRVRTSLRLLLLDVAGDGRRMDQK